MIKKLYFFTFILTCFSLFSQHKPVQNKSAYKPEDLKGFDPKAAWNKAQQRSQKPFEQKEYFNSLQRQYAEAHKNKSGAPVIQSKLPYNYSYDANANRTIINLSPYSSYCPNADFSSMNFSNWTGGTYNNSAGLNWNTFTPAWTPGIVSFGLNTPAQPQSGFGINPTVRHTILTIPPTVNNPPANCIGWDSITINYPSHISDIPFVPPTGGGVTCRLGNANPNYETEELSYVMNVTNQNSQFTYAYAVVLYDGGHAAGEQPFFKVTMTDQSGNPIAGCGQYQVDATLVSTDPTFHRASYYDTFSSAWVDGYTAPGVTDPSWYYDIYYKNWTMVGVDLTAYIGQNVTITFQTADCIYGGHWGYAYIDASCSPAVAVVNMCQNVNTQQVIGPTGYVSYQWYGPNSSTNAIPAPQGTQDTLTVTNGNLGDVYYVTAVSANGCTATMQAILQYSQIGVLFTNSTPSCPGGNSGTAAVTASGSPTGNYTYNWVNSAGQNVGSTQQVTGLSPGTYTVHIASTTPSCGSHDTIVTVGIAPAFVQTQTANFCGNATYLHVPAGSTNIQWYGPGGVAIPAPQGTKDTLLATGTANNQIYVATYINGGCVDSLLITLTQIPGGTLSHTNVTDICVGATNGQATVNLSTTASPPYSYSITGPGFSNSFPSISNTSIPLTGLAYGSYSVSAFDGTCFYSDNFMIDTIPVPVSVIVSPLALCGGPNNNSVMTFSFNSAPPTQCQPTTIPCNNPISYTCGPSNSVTPGSTQYPTPYGNWYTKMRAQYIYTASELNAAGIMAGNLSSIAFNITNLNGTISSYPDFNISIGCSGQSTFTSLSDQTSLITGLTNVFSSPSVNINMGLNTYNFSQPYAWDGVSNLIVDVCFEVPGTFSYTTNAQVSCTSTGNYSSLTLTSDTDPTCNINPTAFYGAYSLQMRPAAIFGWCSATATASMYNFNLNPNISIIPAGSGISTPTTSLQPTSTTHYTLTTTSVYGNCAKKDTFTIFVNPPFNIHMPNPDTLLCSSNPVQNLNPTFIDNTTGNTIQESATWSIHNNAPGITNINGFGLATFNPQIADTGKQYLVITAGGLCQVKDSVLFRVFPFKSSKFTILDSLFCLNDPGVQAQVTSPSGVWSGLGISSSGFFSPQVSGVTNPFTLIQYITNRGTPCADTSTAKMTVVTTPTVNFTSDTTEGCSPVTTIWFSSNVTPLPANGTFKWYFGDGKTALTQNASHTYTLQGTYSPKLTYIDVNGCKDSLTQTNYIIVHPKPNASFYANPPTTDILAPHVDFINTTTPSNCTWAWNVAGVDTSKLKNTSQNFDVEGTYTVILYATSQYNCKDSSVLNLYIDGAYALYAPTSFTPNNDGLNDVFKPVGFGLAENNRGYKMEIFNRWGQRLFETGDVNTGWNGTSNGIALGEDVYVYSISYSDYKNQPHSLKGQVTLLK